MEKHIKVVHKKKKPFRCVAGCNRKFGTKIELQRHNKYYHQAENETVQEELKPSEPSPKAKKGKKNAKIVPKKKGKKNAKIVQKKKGKKNAKIVPEKKGKEEAMAFENIAIPEESEADNAPVKTVPEITGGDEAENGTVQEDLKPSEPYPKA